MGKIRSYSISLGSIQSVVKTRYVRSDNMDFYIYFRYDFVYIYDGGSSFGIGIALLTGILPETITSTGTELFINFVSDMTAAKAGFRIQFDAISG